jgi:hypothetical protein
MCEVLFVDVCCLARVNLFYSSAETNLTQVSAAALSSLSRQNPGLRRSVFLTSNSAATAQKGSAKSMVYSVCDVLVNAGTQSGSDSLFGYVVIESRKPLLKRDIIEFQCTVSMLNTLQRQEAMRLRMRHLHENLCTVGRALKAAVSQVRLLHFASSLHSVVLKQASDMTKCPGTPDSSATRTNKTQYVSRHLLQAESIAKQFNSCFADVIGFAIASIVSVDCRRVLSIHETFSSSNASSLNYVYDTTNESLDLPALSLFLNKIIIKDAGPGHSSSSSPTKLRLSSNAYYSNSSDAREILGWVCVPVSVYKSRASFSTKDGGDYSSNAGGVSTSVDQMKSPRTPAGSSGNGFNSTRVGSSSSLDYLVIQIGFSSQMEWDRYKADVMKEADEDADGGCVDDDNVSVATSATARESESVSGLRSSGLAADNLKEMSLFAAKAVRAWTRNQRKVLFLNQRNNSFNILR